MARKRKAPKEKQDNAGSLEFDPKESRKRIRTYEDVADSEDEFHLNRDEVRLGENPTSKRRRQWAEREEFLASSDEEILGYSEDEDGVGEDSDEDDREDIDGADKTPGGMGSSKLGFARERSARRKTDKAEEEEAVEEEEEEEEDEDDFRWGTSKSDVYGADAIETEEQALEEEAEALRLQRKQLESMRAADYGFDEAEWQDETGSKATQDQVRGQGVVTEVLPQLQIPPDMGTVERLKLLKSRYPEFEPLSKELLQIREILPGLQTDVSRWGTAKHRAASAYLGALVVYFSLLTSTASPSDEQVVAMPANQLREHGVMESLMKCRQLWLDLAALSEEDIAESNEVGVPVNGDSSESDQDTDMAEAQERVLALPNKKTRAERFADAQQEALDARKAERLQRTEAGLADLDALLLSSKKRSAKPARKAVTRGTDQDSDLGEENPLTEREAAEKAKRKKSLRFYTSQIAQKTNKRGNAGKGAGGDDDIPYRERLKDRQARLNIEAEKRGQGRAAPGVELGGDSDEEDHERARKIREEVDDEDYYDLIATKTAKRKSDKAALAEAQRQAALAGGRVIQEETIDPDGKRKITYAIEKNKGLTPHRKKDNRNPRVKKRKKFEEKKKKLSSMKRVYKGGEGRGGYGGELTGIKAGLVKSTKL